MATLYTPTATAQTAALSAFGSQGPTGDNAVLTLQAKIATYALVGTETASDNLYVAKLPKGARVIPHLCNIVCEDPGTALAVNVGDLADADRYGSAIALSAGGSFSLDELATGPLAAYKVGDHADDTGWIVLDITAVDTLTAGAKITITLVYAMIG